MTRYFKRVTCFVLILTLLLNSLSTGFAQAVSDFENINIKEIQIQAIAAELKNDIAEEEFEKENRLSYIKQLEREDRETYLTKERLKTYFKKEYDFGRVMDSFNRQLYEQAGENWKKLFYKDGFWELDVNSKVCYGEICSPYKIFMKALISAWLEELGEQSELVSSYSKYLQDPVFLGAVSLEDKRKLFLLLKESVKNGNSVCKKSDDSREEAKCEDILTSLHALSVMWETDEESKEIAGLAYDILKKYYNKSYGPVIMMEIIAALSFINTGYSYEIIEKFLTEDIAPSKAGNRTRETLSMFSITGEYEIWYEYLNNFVKEGTHFLNRKNENWQYIKEKETRQEKVDPVFIETPGKILDKSESSILASYNVVYGNILTDIGEFLSSQGKRGRIFATKVIRQYIGADEEELKKNTYSFGFRFNSKFRYSRYSYRC